MHSSAHHSNIINLKVSDRQLFYLCCISKKSSVTEELPEFYGYGIGHCLIAWLNIYYLVSEQTSY